MIKTKKIIPQAENGKVEETEKSGDQPSMDNFLHPEQNEEFLEQPSKVNDVMLFLDQMANANKMDDNTKSQLSFDEKIAEITDTSFLVCKRLVFSERMSVKRSKSKNKIMGNTNQFTFMRQIDVTDERRLSTRIERERLAENFRRMGNYEYRRNGFEAAIEMYTKGLEYIVDTPVLYVNRALCYIRLRQYKRGIMDCDYIIAHLDKRYLRAWLYRGAAYRRLNDEKSYEYSIYQATRFNSTETEYINTFLEKLRSMH